MPTTSNFGWTTPADTDLVKDGAAAIRTLGNGIDTSFLDLKGGTSGQVLSKNSNTDLDFTWVAQDDSNAIQNAIVDAKGDLISASAADTPARLAVGANGTILSADSSEATGLKWITPAAGGKVLQVVNSNYSTQTTITSSSYTDTNLSVTITPSAATSKVLVLVSQPLTVDQNASSCNGYTQLLRGATALAYDQLSGISVTGGTSTTLHSMVTFSYLDSPATTSATTYKTQGKKDGNTQLRYQLTPTTASITVLEIGA
jgi:hypothetical protein